MGRFNKMNRDIYTLAEEMLEDQRLCKLIYYSGQHPLRQPDINGVRHLLNKRVLPFGKKIPQVDREGTFILIRPENIRSIQGNNYLRAQLVFEIYTSEKDKIIYDEDNKPCSREMLIMDGIEAFMKNINLSVGKNNFGMAGSIETRNSEFTGYSVVYNDVDFRKW